MKKFLITTAKVVGYFAFLGLLMYSAPKIMSRVLNTQYPLAAITSGSMWPVLKTGDLVIMKGASGVDVEVGQIVVFKNPNGFTIHRLIRKDGNKFITRGDANNVDDKPIESSDIVGRVVYVGESPVRVPRLGTLARYFGSKIHGQASP